VIETHEHAGDFQRAVAITGCDFEQNKSRHVLKRGSFSTA
jgi:hypothetical protein